MKNLIFALFFSAFLVQPAVADMFCTDEFAMMIHEETGHCVAARNGCEISEWIGRGYVRDSHGVCNHNYGPANPIPDDRVCTAEFAVMINDRTGECKIARNGCVISDLIEEGFRRDHTGQCHPEIIEEIEE